MKKTLSCSILAAVILLAGCTKWIDPYFRTTKPGHPELPPQQTIVPPSQQLPQTTIPDSSSLPMDARQNYATTCTVRSSGGSWSASSNDQSTALRNAMHKCKAGSKNPEQCVFSSCTGQ